MLPLPAVHLLLIMGQVRPGSSFLGRKVNRRKRTKVNRSWWRPVCTELKKLRLTPRLTNAFWLKQREKSAQFGPWLNNFRESFILLLNKLVFVFGPAMWFLFISYCRQRPCDWRRRAPGIRNTEIIDLRVFFSDEGRQANEKWSGGRREIELLTN